MYYYPSRIKIKAKKSIALFTLGYLQLFLDSVEVDSSLELHFTELVLLLLFVLELCLLAFFI